MYNYLTYHHNLLNKSFKGLRLASEDAAAANYSGGGIRHEELDNAHNGLFRTGAQICVLWNLLISEKNLMLVLLY